MPTAGRGSRIGNATLELVVDAGLDHLHIAVQRYRRHRGRSPVRKRKEIVLKSDGPMRLETVFEARANEPTVLRTRPIPSLAESVHLGAAIYPATAYLAIDKPLILHHANTSRRSPNPVLTDRAEGRKRQRRMIESGPVKITFDAKQKVTGLNVIASLDTRNKLGEAAVEIVAWNIRIAAGPRPAEIGTDIKS